MESFCIFSLAFINTDFINCIFFLYFFKLIFHKRNGSLKDCEGNFSKGIKMLNLTKAWLLFYFPHKLNQRRIFFFTFHVPLYTEYVINSLEKWQDSELL